MGLLRKIADTFDPPVETRTTWPWWPATNWLGAVDNGGRVVNARTSENLATVLACVSAISAAIASLPAFVYRLTDTGREEDSGHPLARLTRNGPNSKQTCRTSWNGWSHRPYCAATVSLKLLPTAAGGSPSSSQFRGNSYRCSACRTVAWLMTS